MNPTMVRKLGRMEIAQAISNDAYCFNVVLVLNFDHGPDQKSVRELLHILPQRYRMFGVHIEKQKKELSFVSEGTPPIPLQIIPYRDKHGWENLVEDELQRKFDLSIGPLVRFILLHPEGKDRATDILITLQHSICDAVLLSTLLENLLLSLAELEGPGMIPGIQYNDPLELGEQSDKLFPASHKGFFSSLRFLGFLLSQFKDELRFRWQSLPKRLCGRKSYKQRIHTAGANRILTLKMNRLSSRALFRLSRRKRISPNSLLTAAMLLALYRHRCPGQKVSMRTISTADLRPFLQPSLKKNQSGSYFAMLRFTLNITDETDLLSLATDLSHQMHQTLQRGDHLRTTRFSLAIMKMLFRFRSFRMAHTAFSYSGPLALEKKYGPLLLSDLHAFVSNFVLGPEYTGLGRLWQNELYWDLVYIDSDMNRDEASMIGEEMIRILEKTMEETE